MPKIVKTAGSRLSRREFGMAAGAASFLILKPETVWSYQANSAVRLAVLGCGNRGTAVATSFAKNTSARIVALGDIFQDQHAEGKADRGTIPSSLRYPEPD